MTPQTLQKDIENQILDLSKIVLLVIDEAHRATGNYAYCRIIQLLEEQNIGFRILSLSATPVSKIENLQTVANNLRASRLEVRDENDAEIKQYTHDKDIVEIIVEKENHLIEMEAKLFKMMGLALAFLKQIQIVSQTLQPKFISKMTILNLQDEFRGKMQNYAPSMIGCIYERISFLLSICHAKSLLAIHGTESFSDYIGNLFDVTKKDKKNINFLKQIKETEEYKDMMNYIEETKATKNHPKLKKLSEILDLFFKDESHALSKVIIFSQFRDSANEIKRYLDRRNAGIVHAEVFVGQNNNGLT